jgi:hypothetical protein
MKVVQKPRLWLQAVFVSVFVACLRRRRRCTAPRRAARALDQKSRRARMKSRLNSN